MHNKQLKLGKNLVLSSILIGMFFASHVSYAEAPIRGALREQKKEIKGNAKSLLEQVKDMVKQKIKKQLKGQLVTISGNTLTVQKDTVPYTVLISDKTELKRKFGASSTLSEFSPKDTLLIIGNRTKESDGTLSSSEIEASYIRNMSIQRRFAVFTGDITAKSSSTLTLKTVSRGTQIVYVSSTTEYKEKNKAITFADIKIGDKIVVKGELWDRANEKIDAKTIIRLKSQNNP